MAYSYDPICVKTLGNFAAKATAAKTTMTDSANAVLAYTAPAEGAIITRLHARANGTNGASVLYAFTSADAGTTLHLKHAKTAVGETISTTGVQADNDMGPTEEEPWYLAGSERLYVASSVALAAGWEFEGSFKAFG